MFNENNLVKVYLVEFIQYTNCSRDTVYCEDTDEYLSVGRNGFLIREYEIEKYKKFGKGIKSLTLVGYMADV